MKKCLGCESLIPENYKACPKCQHTAFKPHTRLETKTTLTRVNRETTFGMDIMACHSTPRIHTAG